MLSFIAKNLHYPTIAQEKGIQGKVFVRFVVSATGDVKDVKVMRSLDPYCDKEAIRVIQSLPKWIREDRTDVMFRVLYRSYNF